MCFQVPPARGRQTSKATPIRLQCEILYFSPIDVIKQKLKVTFVLTLIWKDRRLHMESLNDDYNLNKVVKSSEVSSFFLSVWLYLPIKLIYIEDIMHTLINPNNFDSCGNRNLYLRIYIVQLPAAQNIGLSFM